MSRRLSSANQSPLGRTDLTQWHLDSSDAGRHVWHYHGATSASELAGVSPFAADTPQSFETKHWLGLPTGAKPLPDPKGDPLKAARNGYTYFKQMQAPDGHWASLFDMLPVGVDDLASLANTEVGPLFLLPGILISCYVTDTPLPQEWKIEIARYLCHQQRSKGPDDNGWGLHIEGRSTVYGTSLNYVALRLLGVGPDEPFMVKARNTLHQLGGAIGAPSWGKLLLAILNCYEWDGLNAVPCELLLMPEWLPVHPWRYWIHMRSVYFPFAYLSAKRWQFPVNDLIKSLRQEIFVAPYESIKWSRERNNIAKVDLYTPHPFILDTLFNIIGLYESYVVPCVPFLRQKGLARAYELVVMDDENTSYQALAPVNKVLNLICRFIEEGPDSDAMRLHRGKIRDFLWMSSQGMMACGTNGSQLWDCVFTTQALVESGLVHEEENKESVVKALEWLADCQIKDNPIHFERAYRQATKGAWPFSTREQGYTVSDCTGEGLKSVLMLQALDYTPKVVPEERLQQAVDILLGMQNPSGGFASYEPTRGSPLLELLNPAEVFGNIMIDYSYPECTTAALTALSLFTKQYPLYRTKDIQRAREGCVKFIHASQRADGSWYGSWGICFTYATMFALESLASFGETYENSARVRKACEFLLARQMDDGGWGESFRACETGQYIHNLSSQMTNTSWALIALMVAKCPNIDVIKKGVRLIISRQKPDGHWDRESIEGIFNKSCAISYPNFLFSWTIMALGKAAKQFPDAQWLKD